MKSIFRLRYLYTKTTQRQVHNALKDQNKQKKILNNNNKQKLDLVAQAISNMSKRQQKYLTCLLRDKDLQRSENLFDLTIKSTFVNKDVDTRSYFLQQQNIRTGWQNEFDLTLLLYSSESTSSNQQAKVEAKVKEIFDVELTTVNAAEKIKVIKVIRQALGLGLKEAKELVEKTPVVIKQAKKDQANALAELLTKAGCIITVK